MRKFNVNGKLVGEDSSVFVIAEAGVNHIGSFIEAKKMVEVASLSMADAVTFQHIAYNEINSSKCSKSESDWDKWRLSDEQIIELFDDAHRFGLSTTACVVDFKSLEFVVKSGADFLKVVSGDITCHPFLVECAKTNLPIFLSTGSALLPEIEDALEVIDKSGGKNVVVYQTNTKYPTPPNEVDLRAMEVLKKFKYPVGFCDHTAGTAISLAAVALGAHVIEKHFSLDATIKRPDYQVSINPHELNQFVADIRNIKEAMGRPIKRRHKDDENFILTRRSLVARNDMVAGTKIQWSDLAYKRPGTGTQPSEAKRFIGRNLKYDVSKDDQLYEDMLDDN
ncbi:N-acetylneuraminate synthase family protein [Bacillus bingmayongensis]|uniref:N-acetylneuraminate synthase family protein n=1 Tax=Bacillus bingmayongensis TaxID=1150157 RepID=UPI00031DD1C0|nr:N-acetylneuraminate synthase family protein [Bacillus bingmayongensis]MBY0600225.1 N-acetylneuraminate synthase family protein [Bacillus bingmayongensis]